MTFFFIFLLLVVKVTLWILCVICWSREEMCPRLHGGSVKIQRKLILQLRDASLAIESTPSGSHTPFTPHGHDWWPSSAPSIRFIPINQLIKMFSWMLKIYDISQQLLAVWRWIPLKKRKVGINRSNYYVFHWAGLLSLTTTTTLLPRSRSIKASVQVNYKS